MAHHYPIMASLSAAALLLIISASGLMLLPPLSAGAAASPPALDPIIGMPGCETRCGNMDVPYPFGLGPARCYWPGFNLTCDRSISKETPRLLLGDGTLQVENIGFGSGPGTMIFVRAPGDIKVNIDGIGSLAGGLGDNGPYALSSVNELSVTGCNVRATLKNGNVTMASCSSLCVSGDEPLSLESCSGEGCCQAAIVINREVVAGSKLVNITSYDVELEYLGWNNAVDQKWPARVFVAGRGWFASHQQLRRQVETQVPFVLEWEVVLGEALPDRNTSSRECPSDAASRVCKSKHSLCFKGARGGYTCGCKDGYDGNPYLPHGCQDIDECKDPLETRCYGDCINTMGSFECRCPAGTAGDPKLPGRCFSSLADNCTAWCGNVSVPYPFGIGPVKCYLPGFNLTCDKSKNPPQLLLGNHGTFRVVDISLRNNTLRVINTGKLFYMPGWGSLKFDFMEHTSLSFGFSIEAVSGDRVLTSHGEVPYSVSTRNELILMGCDVQTVLLGTVRGNSTILGGCSSFCSSNENYTVIQGGASNAVNEKYCYGRDCCQSRISMSMGGMPTELIISRATPNNDGSPAFVLISEEGWFDKRRVSAQLQHLRLFTTDTLEVPIILDWEVLQSADLHPPSNGSLQHRNCPMEVASSLCKSKNSLCTQRIRGYSCQCSSRYDGNPYLVDGCQGGGRKRLKGIVAIVGVGAASGASLIVLVFTGFIISKNVTHWRAQMVRRKFFELNRGQLLQQLVSQRAGISEKMIIPLAELEKATNNFDKTRELGGGGHGTVYKGILSDLHVVAIKKPKKVVQREIDEFINEVAILSQINHRNVVRLYGCCLETEVPMLVYEFISNGTLHDHLHVDGPTSLAWDDRLRIAVETAKSIAYLHSTASIHIIHRDIKSVNILLDDSLTAKVADFGASRYVPMDKSGVTTAVQGTIGYMDPMYFCTGRLTEKSDVYGFGVMLVELLTRQKPFFYLSSEDEGLAAHFATLFVQGKLSDILDPQVIEEGGKEVEEVAAVAVACIKLTREDRPTMRQVEFTLEGLRASKEHILGNAIANKVDKNDIAVVGRSDEESSRQYSMEQEFILSARYPR